MKFRATEISCGPIRPGQIRIINYNDFYGSLGIKNGRVRVIKKYTDADAWWVKILVSDHPWSHKKETAFMSYYFNK